ncbi:MAG: guanylate kinase [Terriglobales bacterium]
MSGILFIISAPSGSGKTTLTNELLRLVPGLEFSVSYTTRPPRGSERHGREYFFVSKETFEGMIADDEFLEHACVFGHYYGTAKRFLAEAFSQGKDLVLDIDVQGAAQVKKKMPEAVSIFIMPPSREILEFRLRNRSHNEHVDDETVRRRLDGARKEIENYSNYDYILVNENDRLEQSIELLKAVVSSERARRCHSPSVVASDVEERARQCLRDNVRDRAEQILRSFEQ